MDAIKLTKVRNDFGVTYEKLLLTIAGYAVNRKGRIAVRTKKDKFSK